MYHSPRKRSAPVRGITWIDVVVIVLVIIALAALVGYVITEAGGGHLMT